MLTFLFWNINNRPLHQRIARLVERHEVDLLLLAESGPLTGRVLEALNGGTRSRFQLQSSAKKVALFTRFSGRFLRRLGGGKRFDFYELALPGRTGVVLGAAHLPDKRSWRHDESQAAEAEALVRQLQELEAAAGHARSLVVGDFNMNPFEPGMVKASGMNAVMARDVASREKRKVLDREYPYFYNPMWGHFGERGGGPPGSYYYDNSEHVTYYWNIFDQVLLRPALLSLFKDEDVRILTEDAGRSLLSARGRPDKSSGSDHLPLLFRLDI
jgi:hypothetical protein